MILLHRKGRLHDLLVAHRSLRGCRLLVVTLIGVALHMLAPAALAQGSIPIEQVLGHAVKIPKNQFKPWETDSSGCLKVNQWYQSFDPAKDAIKGITFLPDQYNILWAAVPSNNSVYGYKLIFGVEYHGDKQPIGHPSLAVSGNRSRRPVYTGGNLSLRKGIWTLDNGSGRTAVQQLDDLNYPGENLNRTSATALYNFRRDINTGLERGRQGAKNGIIIGIGAAPIDEALLVDAPDKVEWKFTQVQRGFLNNSQSCPEPDRELVMKYRKGRRSGVKGFSVAGTVGLDLLDEASGGALGDGAERALSTAVTTVGAEPLLEYAAEKDKEAWEKYPIMRAGVSLFGLLYDIPKALIADPALDYVRALKRGRKPVPYGQPGWGT